VILGSGIIPGIDCPLGQLNLSSATAELTGWAVGSEQQSRTPAEITKFINSLSKAPEYRKVTFIKFDMDKLGVSAQAFPHLRGGNLAPSPPKEARTRPYAVVWLVGVQQPHAATEIVR
jgi:hypothetical protein